MQISYFGFQDEDPTDAGEGESLAGHVGYPLHLEDLVAGVAAVTPVGADRFHDLLGVEPAHEGGLHAEHGRHLPDGEDRQLVVEGCGHALV